MDFYSPPKGYGYNPLMKHDRNGPCVCGSDKKYKKCCLPIMVDYVPLKVLENMKNKNTEEQCDIFVKWLKRRKLWYKIKYFIKEKILRMKH